MSEPTTQNKVPPPPPPKVEPAVPPQAFQQSGPPPLRGEQSTAAVPAKSTDAASSKPTNEKVATKPEAFSDKVGRDGRSDLSIAQTLEKRTGKSYGDLALGLNKGPIPMSPRRLEAELHKNGTIKEPRFDATPPKVMDAVPTRDPYNADRFNDVARVGTEKHIAELKANGEEDRRSTVISGLLTGAGAGAQRPLGRGSASDGIVRPNHVYTGRTHETLRAPTVVPAATGAPPKSDPPASTQPGPPPPKGEVSLDTSTRPRSANAAPPPPERPTKPPGPVVETIATDGANHPVIPPEGKYFDNTNSPHHHVVDQYGRPILAQGWTRPEAAPRHNDQKVISQFMLGRAGGTEASHGIAARFGGDGRWFNLTPLPREVNQSGGIGEFERAVAARTATGQPVFIQAYANYAGTGQVPGTVQYRAFVNEGGRPRQILERTFAVSH